VVGLLLYFIVLTVVSNSNAKVPSTGSFELNEEDLREIEENPFENDLERFIHEAKTSGNLKLAIRLSFLYIIRLLSERSMIKWKKDKTNAQYFYELKGTNFQSSYAQLKMLFETTWYGDVELEQKTKKAALEKFDSDIKNLKSLKTA